MYSCGYASSSSHVVDTESIHNEDGNHSRATLTTALGRCLVSSLVGSRLDRCLKLERNDGISTVAAAGQRHVNSQPHDQSFPNHLRSRTRSQLKDLQHSFRYLMLALVLLARAEKLVMVQQGDDGCGVVNRSGAAAMGVVMEMVVASVGDDGGYGLALRATIGDVGVMFMDHLKFRKLPDVTSTTPDYELTEEDENQEDDDTMGEDQEDEENRELYGDLNFNLDRQDAEMTDAQTNQETEEARVTLTTEPPVVQQQSSSFSSDLVAKFINPSPDTVRCSEEFYRAFYSKIHSNKVPSSSYGEVVILKAMGVMIKTKMKNPPLDQTEGSSKGTTRSPQKSSSKSVQEEEHDPSVDDLEEPFHQEFDTGNDDVSPIREATDVDER
ncbi:hypothetical protein Tco_0717178, partial [Tanacetum coccineum]